MARLAGCLSQLTPWVGGGAPSQTPSGEFLEIVVDAYPHPISYRGHYFQRSGSTLQELKGAALDRFLLRRQGRTWDGVPMPGVKVVDLSSAAVRQFRDLARASGRLDPADLRSSKAVLIEKLQLTEGAYLKRAAVLLFHEDPEKYVTGAFVKVGFFRSESDLAYHDTIHGDLFTQAARTIDLVRTKYLKAAIANNKSADAKRGFRDRRQQTLFIDALKFGTLIGRVSLARWYPGVNDGGQQQRATNRLNALTQLVVADLGMELIDMGTQEGGTYPIRQRMYEAIGSSEIFIADLTGLRPNVLIELG